MTEQLVSIYYDDNCMFCRSLAKFIEPHSPNTWNFEPINSDGDDNLSLVIKANDVEHKNDDAWLYILTTLPQLSSLSWLARKIGLEKQTARTFYKTTHGLRALCKSCKSWGPKR